MSECCFHLSTSTRRRYGSEEGNVRLHTPALDEAESFMAEKWPPELPRAVGSRKSQLMQTYLQL